MNLSIADIRRRVIDLGRSISAPMSFLIIPDAPTSDGAPYVEIINGEYHYVSAERGMEIYRRNTENSDELLYWIFKRIASAMATEYEFQNRVQGQDTRRIKFSKQIEIMGILNKSWCDSVKTEIEKILQSSPYDDSSDERVILSKVLMDNGMSGEQAYESACKTFPLPEIKNNQHV